jgi:hypothetical protein
MARHTFRLAASGPAVQTGRGGEARTGKPQTAFEEDDRPPGQNATSSPSSCIES